MADSITPSLITLPIELVYRTLDHLDPVEILLSVRDVCTRLNAIIGTYQPYQVNAKVPIPSRSSSYRRTRRSRSTPIHPRTFQ